jgi:hypothetical protein
MELPSLETRSVSPVGRPQVNVPILEFPQPDAPHPAIAEQVALGMIARHGANAARQAAVHLNTMIDHGNLPARDLWACIVYVIHQQVRSENRPL